VPYETATAPGQFGWKCGRCRDWDRRWGCVGFRIAGLDFRSRVPDLCVGHCGDSRIRAAPEDRGLRIAWVGTLFLHATDHITKRRESCTANCVGSLGWQRVVYCLPCCIVDTGLGRCGFLALEGTEQSGGPKRRLGPA